MDISFKDIQHFSQLLGLVATHDSKQVLHSLQLVILQSTVDWKNYQSKTTNQLNRTYLYTIKKVLKHRHQRTRIEGKADGEEEEVIPELVNQINQIWLVDDKRQSSWEGQAHKEENLRCLFKLQIQKIFAISCELFLTRVAFTMASLKKLTKTLNLNMVVNDQMHSSMSQKCL